MAGIDAARNRKRSKAEWWHKNAGGDPNRLYDQAIVDESKGGGWQNAFEQSAGAYLSRAMPQFRELAGRLDRNMASQNARNRTWSGALSATASVLPMLPFRRGPAQPGEYGKGIYPGGMFG